MEADDMARVTLERKIALENEEMALAFLLQAGPVEPTGPAPSTRHSVSIFGGGHDCVHGHGVRL
jgi:hypothetical protein